MKQDLDKIFNSLKSGLPNESFNYPVEKIIGILKTRFGLPAENALDPDCIIPSPAAAFSNTEWIKRLNTVGVNVRTIKSFWNLIPYALTLPDAQDAIHILPVWEPGVVSSLYGPSSWNINPEFFSPELAEAVPALDTVEKQLKVVVNLLHLLGKSVGMDVVPHTDRYSEQALGNPQFFEWLQRRDLEIVRHSGSLHSEVQMSILAWLFEAGAAIPGVELKPDPLHFFEQLPEPERLRCLFGEIADYAGRLQRRKLLMNHLYDEGFETVPATMAPPYRGIEVDPSPSGQFQDEDGRIWRDYRIINPQPMSRVFGPLARYRLYESAEGDYNWTLDFDRPVQGAWSYVCEHYFQIQDYYNFDFMRGDMSHVQMRPEGVPEHPDAWYDLQLAVKQYVGRNKPYFGYFAESFLAAPDTMAYGDECAHLEAAQADSTLGDLQSEPVGTTKFIRDFCQYREWLDTRRFAPNFTLFTADKDDPRFDKFYLDGNEIRYFIALFLPDMPSYMGLGFECRDPHPQPAPNEFYTKLYVFQLPDGPKGTKSPYRWGSNIQLYERIVRQKLLSDQIVPAIRSAGVHWLIAPDPAGKRKVIAWTQDVKPEYIFMANLDTHKPAKRLKLPNPGGHWQLAFSTETTTVESLVLDGPVLTFKLISPGEGLVLINLSKPNKPS